MKVAPNRLHWLFFLIIVLEGYAVLASELLAIRLVLPYVGNGADTVSIIIAAVLLPLAFGYHVGGRNSARGVHASLRERLSSNIAQAAIILSLGLSYIVLDLFFFTLIDMGVTGRVPLAVIYSMLFIVLPVYRLGQTVPLITAYFPAQKQGALAGRILFFSTIGSFCGAILTTLVLMNIIGVYQTASVVLGVLGLLFILISRRAFTRRSALVLGFVLFGIFLNSSVHFPARGIISSNVYNTVAVMDENSGGKTLLLNYMSSSRLGPNGEKFGYIDFVEKNLMPKNLTGQKLDILVIGAAGFTFGLEDPYNNYTFVDIDPDIKQIAEEKFLNKKLGANKQFVPSDIRAFLRTNTKQFDMVFLDAFSGDLQVPDALTTKDFFTDLKRAMKPSAIFAGNFILSPNYLDAYSRNIDATLRSVFPYLHRNVLGAEMTIWLHSDEYANVVYSAVNDNQQTGRIYTDNKNPIAFDRPAKSSMARFK